MLVDHGHAVRAGDVHQGGHVDGPDGEVDGDDRLGAGGDDVAAGADAERDQGEFEGMGAVVDRAADSRVGTSTRRPPFQDCP